MIGPTQHLVRSPVVVSQVFHCQRNSRCGSSGINAVAEVYGDTLAAADDRASLIAAAPDLLAVCERLVEFFTESHAEEVEADHHGDESCSYCDAMDAANTAIRKARGE